MVQSRCGRPAWLLRNFDSSLSEVKRCLMCLNQVLHLQGEQLSVCTQLSRKVNDEFFLGHYDEFLFFFFLKYKFRDDLVKPAPPHISNSLPRV